MKYIGKEVIFPITLVGGILITGSIIKLLGCIDPSYFANKKNIINIIFVKNGWFWTSVGFFSLWINFVLSFLENNQKSRWRRQRIDFQNDLNVNESEKNENINGINLNKKDNGIRKNNKDNKIIENKENLNSISGWDVILPLLRYIIATTWWYLFTQWFFGSPIMDKVFILSGGHCDIDGNNGENNNIVHSATCRHKKGTWEGGFDPSGHVFLLSQSIFFLWFEILPTLKTNHNAISYLSTKIILIIISLWLWMLLMTAMHFHTIGEKFSGFLFSLIILIQYVGFGLITRIVGTPHSL